MEEVYVDFCWQHSTASAKLFSKKHLWAWINYCIAWIWNREMPWHYVISCWYVYNIFYYRSNIEIEQKVKDIYRTSIIGTCQFCTERQYFFLLIWCCSHKNYVIRSKKFIAHWLHALKELHEFKFTVKI